MSKIDEFYNSHVNKSWDKWGKTKNVTYPEVSGSFTGQCVSLIKTYLYYLFGDRVDDSYGDAKDYWQNRSWNGILDLCDVVSSPKDGDIVVSAGGDARYGHVYIYYKNQAFAQNVANNPKAVLTPLSWQGAVFGYLRPKSAEVTLIPEHRFATVTSGHNINIRKDSVTGKVVKVARSGDTIEYTEKCVTNGHRYVSWVENGSRYFMAVTPTEEQKNHWVTISGALKKEKLIIDISAHQGSIDFSKVKVDGVILRCGYGTMTDDRFLEYAEGCRKYKIPIVGLYVFDYAVNADQAKDEAEFAVRCAERIGLDKNAVLWFDCEGDSARYYRQQNGVELDGPTVWRHTRIFMDTVKKHGYKTGFYSNLDWMRNRYKGFEKKDDELFWFARYDHTPELPYDLLQYTSGGKVDGIKGLVDMNRTYSDSDTINSVDDAKPKTPKWNINGVVTVGCSVKSISCAITGIQGDCVNVPALGGLVPLSDVSEADDTGDGSKDDYLANTNARVYLNECKAEAINGDLIKVNGYWVHAGPLMVKE